MGYGRVTKMKNQICGWIFPGRCVTSLIAAACGALLLFALGCESDSGDRAGDYYQAGQVTLGSPPSGSGASAPTDPTTPEDPEALSVAAVPASLELNADGEIAVLEASGGRAPYTWSVQYASRGGLNRTTGSSVIYTRNSSGNNVITVVGGGGQEVNILIRQP